MNTDFDIETFRSVLTRLPEALEDFDESDLPNIVELQDMAATDAKFLERVRKDFLLLA